MAVLSSRHFLLIVLNKLIKNYALLKIRLAHLVIFAYNTVTLKQQWLWIGVVCWEGEHNSFSQEAVLHSCHFFEA